MSLPLRDEPPIMNQRCVNGSVDVLTLTVETEPTSPTIFPGWVEGRLLLSHDSLKGRAEGSSSRAGDSSSGGRGDEGQRDRALRGDPEDGVVWSVEALRLTPSMKWSMVPSTGLLLAGERRVDAWPRRAGFAEKTRCIGFRRIQPVSRKFVLQAMG